MLLIEDRISLSIVAVVIRKLIPAESNECCTSNQGGSRKCDGFVVCRLKSHSRESLYPHITRIDLKGLIRVAHLSSQS